MIAKRKAIHSHHKRVAAGALLIGVFTLAAKLFVAAREIAIAWRYGVSGTVDAYQLAITATTWTPMMLAGVMTWVLVPRLVALQRRGADRRQFINELNGSVLIAGLVLTALTWLMAPLAADLLASEAKPDTLRLTAKLTADMAPIALFMVVSAYWSARLQSRERYGYSVTEAASALTIALFVAASSAGAGVWPLLVGTLVGYLAQLVLLGALVERGDPPIGRISLRHRSSHWQKLHGSFLLMLSGHVLLSASVPIDQGFAARLGEGAVATFGYANRIVGLFSGIATVVIARAVLPVMSESVADGNIATGRRHAIQWSLLLGALATIGSAVVWFIAPDVVRLLFQRGAFTKDASAVVSSVLRAGLLQLPFYFAFIVLVQWYAATARYGVFLGVYAAAIVMKVVLNAVLVQQWGVEGLMLSTAAMYAFTFLSFFALLGRARPAVPLPEAP